MLYRLDRGVGFMVFCLVYYIFVILFKILNVFWLLLGCGVCGVLGICL